jgi:hypothetical protein
MYPLESPNFAEKLSRRKEAALQTLRPTSTEELHALSHELFPDGTTPGRQHFRNLSRSTRQNQPFEVKLRKGLSLFTTRVPIAASGGNESVKSMPWVCWMEPLSKCFLKLCPKLGVPDLSCL